MKTFTNILSILCILASFAIIPVLWLELFWVAFILFIAAAILNWISIAFVRGYDLNRTLSHIGMNLLVVNSFTALLVLPTAPAAFWYIKLPIMLMLAGEAWFASMYEVSGNRKVKMSSHVSKASMVISLIALLAFFVMFLVNVPASLALHKIYLLCLAIGTICLWVALIVAIWSAIYNFSSK